MKLIFFKTCTNYKKYIMSLCRYHNPTGLSTKITRFIKVINKTKISKINHGP